MLLGDLAQAGELRAAGIREHYIKPALLSFDLGEETIEIAKVRHVSLYAGYVSSDLLYRRPMPLVPPVMSAILPSSLCMDSSSVK